MEQRTSYLEEAILSPGNVEINVQGAFIAEEENHWIDGMQRDTRDIRLPNHKTVVSHVALDVKPQRTCDLHRPTLTSCRSAVRWPSSSTSHANPTRSSLAGV